MSRLLDETRSILRAIEGSLFDSVPAHSMVLCRVGLGAILFLAYLSRWTLVETIYGPTGYGGYEYHQRFPDHPEIGWPPLQRFNELQYVPYSEVIWLLYLLLLTSALLFSLGVRPKLFGTIALVLHVLFVARNPAATWGWATMIKPFMLYAILAADETHGSLVEWWRRRKERARARTDWRCPAWPIRLMQIHAACVFFVLWTRFDEPSWVSGQMLPMALTNRDWGRFDVDWFPYYGVLESFGVVALILETAAPIMLWIKPIGKYWALALMGMFATLVVTTSVGWWDFMMLFALTVFLPAEWLDRIMRPSRTTDVVPSEVPHRSAADGLEADP